MRAGKQIVTNNHPFSRTVMNGVKAYVNEG